MGLQQRSSIDQNVLLHRGSGHASHTDHGEHDEQTKFAAQAEAEAAAASFGCTGAHQMGDTWMVRDNMTEMTATNNQDPDIPTLESALNINKKKSPRLTD